MSDMSFYEIASDVSTPEVDETESQSLELLDNFWLEPARVHWTGKAISLHHVCGWHIHLDTYPNLSFADVIGTIRTHLRLKECKEYGRAIH